MIIAFSISVSGEGERGADAASGSAEATAAGSVSHAVAAAVNVVRTSGLPHHTSSMFTEIEGEWDEVMGVIKECVEAIAPYGARISLVMKADIRAQTPGNSGEITKKVSRVDEILSHSAPQSQPPATASTSTVDAE